MHLWEIIDLLEVLLVCETAFVLPTVLFFAFRWLLQVLFGWLKRRFWRLPLYYRALIVTHLH